MLFALTGSGKTRLRRSVPRLESLEDRTVPALTSSVVAGVLTVTSDAADAIAVTASVGYVLINGASPDSGAALASGLTRIVVTGSADDNAIDLTGVLVSEFTSLDEILVAAGDGDDTVFGSAFDETLLGGLGGDFLVGNGGDDVLDGYQGNDTLQGGGGNDTAGGGLGDDLIFGGADDDLLRGDTTDTPRGLADDGLSQSPVDIPAGTPTQLLIDRFAYEPSTLEIDADGHLEFLFDPQNFTNSFTIDGITFNLANIHFHVPSEYTVGGEAFAAEVHFVHTTPEGATAVLGVFVRVGAANAAFQKLLDHAVAGEHVVVPDQFINPADLLPADRRVYAFSGSLTTSPFTEGLNWFSFAAPITLAQAQLDQFAVLAAASGVTLPNARPTQPLFGRTFGHGNDTLSGGTGRNEIFTGGGVNVVVAGGGIDVIHTKGTTRIVDPAATARALFAHLQEIQRTNFTRGQRLLLQQRLSGAQFLFRAGRPALARQVRLNAVRAFNLALERLAIRQRIAREQFLASLTSPLV